MLKGGENSTKVLVPGKAAQSDLYIAVTWNNPDLEMPPKENDRLTEEQTWFIRDWINGGAPWPDEDRVAMIRRAYSDGVVVKTSGGLAEDWNNRRYKTEHLWPYQPLKYHADSEHASPLDEVIDRRLSSLGLEPAPPADRRITEIQRAGES